MPVISPDVVDRIRGALWGALLFSDLSRARSYLESVCLNKMTPCGAFLEHEVVVYKQAGLWSSLAGSQPENCLWQQSLHGLRVRLSLQARNINLEELQLSEMK
jgi:hypothetical protein